VQGCSTRPTRLSQAGRRLSLDEAHHRRGRELAEVVSDLDRGGVVEVLDGRSRRRVERYLRSLAGGEPAGDRGRLDRPLRGLPPGDPQRASPGADRGRPLPPRARRQHRARLGPARARPPPAEGARRSAKGASWRQDLYRARHRLLKASERLTERERRRLIALFEREPTIAGAWGLKEPFRSIYRAPDRHDAERRLDRFLAAVERAQLPAFTAFAEGVRLWRAELLAYFDEPTTNGYAEGVINKVKLIKRRAYGPPRLDGFRQRVLLACA
jgi:transposase